MPTKLPVRQLSKRGFTLAELLIVVAVLAAAVAIAIPLTGNAFSNAQLRIAASYIASLSMQAHNRAMYEARSYMVVFGPDDPQGRNVLLVRDDGKATGRIALPAHVSLEGQLWNGDWNGELPAMRFFPDGTSDFGKLDLANRRGSHVQLAFDATTGRVKVTQIYKASGELR